MNRDDVLPSCKRYIIEAIRRSRAVRKGGNGYPGKPLWRIYDLVKVYYDSDLQFFVFEFFQRLEHQVA